MPSPPRVDLLRGAAFFQGLGESELSCIAAKLTSHSYEKGAALFRAGDPGDALFLLARGKVAIRDGHRHLVPSNGSGGSGELADVSPWPGSADAVCEESCEVLRLKASDLQTLMATHPAVQRQVMLALVHRVKEAGSRTPGR